MIDLPEAKRCLSTIKRGSNSIEIKRQPSGFFVDKIACDDSNVMDVLKAQAQKKGGLQSHSPRFLFHLPHDFSTIRFLEINSELKQIAEDVSICLRCSQRSWFVFPKILTEMPREENFEIDILVVTISEHVVLLNGEKFESDDLVREGLMRYVEASQLVRGQPGVLLELQDDVPIQRLISVFDFADSKKLFLIWKPVIHE